MQHKSKNSLRLVKLAGKTIKKLRMEKTGLSVNQFSFKVEIEKGNLSRLENGLNDPKLTTLWKIAQGLEIPLSEFIKELEKSAKGKLDLLDSDS